MVDWDSKIVHFKSRKRSDNFKDDFIDRTITRGFENYIKGYVDVQSYIS